MTEKKLDTSRPFRRADALTDGITAKELRGPRFRTIFRGVLIDACVKVTPKLRAEAALRLFDPTAFASHASAARLLDVPIPTLPDEHVTVFHHRMRRHHRGIRTHVSDTMDVRKVNGVLLSDYGRMFVELAELIGLVDLVVVGDHFARKGWITPVELVAYCATSTHRAARAARRAAAYVRADVDSPMETRLRMLLVLAGLPEPEINVKIRAADGEVMRRYDLSFPNVRVIVEYDGRNTSNASRPGSPTSSAARPSTTTGGGSWWWSRPGSTSRPSGLCCACAGCSERAARRECRHSWTTSGGRTSRATPARSEARAGAGHV